MNYVAIRIANLIPDVTLRFDLYLRLFDRHILYVRGDETLEGARLNRLIEKGVREIYIREDQLAALHSFLEESSEAAINDPVMPMEKKTAVIVGQSKAAVEDMFHEPESKEHYQAAEAAAKNQVKLFLKHPAAMEQMLQIAARDRTTFQHSVNVATLAVGLAAAIGAPAEACNAIGLGGLLHDIGKSRQENQVNRDPEKMTPQELEDYAQHPRIGASLLEGKKYVSVDVLDIVLLHEERLDGKGFPAGIRKLAEIFQVVGLANLYDKQVTIQGKNPRAVLESILKMNPVPYDPRLIAGLKDLLVAAKFC